MPQAPAARLGLVAALAPLVATGCASARPGEAALSARPAPAIGGAVAPVEGYYGDVLAALQRRDYVRALELLQVARQKAPSDVRIWNALGVVYDKLGRPDLSGRYYAEALRLDPGSPIVEANLSYSARLRGETSTASTALAMQAIQPVQPTAVGAAPPPEGRGNSTGDAAPSGLASSPPVRPLPVATAPTASQIQLAVALPVQASPAPGLGDFARTPARLTAAMALSSSEASESSPVQPTPTVKAQPLLASALAVAPAPAKARVEGRNIRVASVRRTSRPPLMILNATGQARYAEPIRLSLSSRGWSAPQWAVRQARVQARTVVFYPADRLEVGRALAATLPGRSRLLLCSTCGNVQLVLGFDARAWRPLRALVVARSRA